MMPLAVMMLNYVGVMKSEHPFLVNVRKSNPITVSLFILYGSGLSIILPKTYLISYLAYGTSHLLWRSLRKQWMEKKF